MKTENHYQEALVLLSCQKLVKNQIIIETRKSNSITNTILKYEDKKTNKKNRSLVIAFPVLNSVLTCLIVLGIVLYNNNDYTQE